MATIRLPLDMNGSLVRLAFSVSPSDCPCEDDARGTIGKSFHFSARTEASSLFSSDPRTDVTDARGRDRGCATCPRSERSPSSRTIVAWLWGSGLEDVNGTARLNSVVSFPRGTDQNCVAINCQRVAKPIQRSQSHRPQPWPTPPIACFSGESSRRQAAIRPPTFACA